MPLDQNRRRLLDLGPQQCLKREGARGPIYFRKTEDNVVRRASKDQEGEWMEREVGVVTPNQHVNPTELTLELAHNEYEIVSLDEYPFD